MSKPHEPLPDGYYVLMTWNKKAAFRILILSDLVVEAAPYGRSLVGKPVSVAATWGTLTKFAEADA